MEPEVSLFETTEMVANFLTSTTILVDSWNLCSKTDSSFCGPTDGFVVDQIGPIGLMGFSGLVNIGPGLGPFMQDMVNVQEGVGDGIFNGIGRYSDDCDDPVMLHAALLKLFLNLHANPNFQTQIKALVEKSKSIILTGHSVGGAIASLATLWLLSCFQNFPSPPQVLCITFGSPLLGNKSLSKSLLRHRWAGNFCHVILKHDIVPRLLFAPLASISTHLDFLFKYIQQMTTPQLGQLGVTDDMKNQLFSFVLAHTQATAANVGRSSSMFWPFGNYVFCSENGAVCVDNGTSVVKLLHLMLAMGNSDVCFEDHLGYGNCVHKLSVQLMMRRGFTQGDVPNSSYEAGLALALDSSGIASQESVSGQVKDCLKMAKQMGLTPNLNSARLAISLSKITPHRAQIEWYKSSCDESDDLMGYYDCFKKRQASKRDNQVNLFRIKLASFWDNVINMIHNNELPHDFHKRPKWVNAAHFYQLLVEPLDIAEYYRSGEHLRKGHYLKNGRHRRHEIFDKWWRETDVDEEQRNRSKFASLTQDSCFWARVEEARELLEKVRTERNSSNRAVLWQATEAFERYAGKLIGNKEVSTDVLAKNSSYRVWIDEVRELRLQTQQFPQFPGVVDGEMVP